MAVRGIAPGLIDVRERKSFTVSFVWTSNAPSPPNSPVPPAVLASDVPLPPHLAERVAAPTAGKPLPDHGAYVLYWARTAVRAHENPALDVALVLAAHLGLPLFVYHALSERYPYASDRHHMFILEGARDFAAELATRGIGTAFHLEREGHRGPHLVTLASRAAIVVTELMPVAPLDGWTASLRAAVAAPVWEVDTACVVPMPLTTRAYDRAFVYRDATAGLRHARVGATWHDAPAPGSPFVPDLPFAPIDLSSADLGDLIAGCRIDHGVGPVSDTRGGSVAGYARWNEFVSSGRLDRYDKLRNDPTRGDGVSRMSAYLHYGMVSPLRLAREAAAMPEPALPSGSTNSSSGASSPTHSASIAPTTPPSRRSRAGRARRCSATNRITESDTTGSAWRAVAPAAPSGMRCSARCSRMARSTTTCA